MKDINWSESQRVNVWSGLPKKDALMAALAHTARLPGQEIELIVVNPTTGRRDGQGWLLRVFSCYDGEDGPYGQISLWVPADGPVEIWDTTRLFDEEGRQLWTLEWNHHNRLCQATYRGKTGRLYGVDIDWCERDQCYYWHEHGSGPGPRVHLCGKVEGYPSTLWAHDYAQFEMPIPQDPDNPRGPRPDPCSKYVTREDLAAKGYTFRMAPPTEDPCRSNIEGQVYHCEPCTDTIPEDEPCEHGDPEPG